MDEILCLWMEVIQMNDDEQAFELDRGFLFALPVCQLQLYHEMTHVISHFPFLLDAFHLQS